MKIPIKKSGGLLTLIIVCCISSCGEKKVEKQQQKGYCLNDFKNQIEVTQAEIRAVSEGLHLTGTVEANPDKVVRYTSLLNGIISNASFSLGDRVTAGQVLAELKSTDLSDMNMQSKSITEQIKTARRKLESVQSMHADGIASEKELTEAQSALNILLAEKEKVNSNYSLYGGSTGKGTFQIKAPVTGIITAKTISSGTPISASNEPLFTISDLNEVWVMVNIYATDLRNITQGMEVDIKTLSYPDEIFKGKIATISQVLDEDARVLKAKVVMQNKDLKLKPGMLVDVMAQKQSGTSALSIPIDALVFDDNQNFVLVYKDDCDIEIRKIEILTKNAERIFISAGLKEHEKIVSKNQLLVYDQIKKN